MNKKSIKWLEKNFKADLTDKNIIITGANSGIGFEVSYICASLNANVFMAVRNKTRGEAAKEKILKDYPNANIKLLPLDVSSVESIHEFADSLSNNNIDVDIFYNNAGVLKANRVSKDNIELVMATNYIGTYLLNELLFDYFLTLNHRVKVIFTNSIAMYLAKIDYNDFFNETKYKSFKAYCNSKLALTHYFINYTRKCEEKNVDAVLVHPGVTYTPLISKSFNKVIAKLADLFMDFVFHKVDIAALSTMYLLNDNICNNTNVGPRGILGMSGLPKKKKIPKRIFNNYIKTVDFTADFIKEKFYNEIKEAGE